MSIEDTKNKKKDVLNKEIQRYNDNSLSVVRRHDLWYPGNYRGNLNSMMK